MTEQDAQTEKPKIGAKRVAWHALRVSWWLLALPVVFALIIAISVIDRDVTAPSWIKNRIEERAADLLGGGTLRFGEIKVNIGRDLHPRVRLTDATLTDAQGAPLAQVSEISGLMSPRGVFLQRDVLMQEVAVVGAQIALLRRSDGSVALSFNNTATEKVAPDFGSLLEQLDTTFATPALEALETVRISSLVVNYTDARAGRQWTVDGGTVDLDLRDDQTSLRGAFSLLSGGTQVTNLALDYSSPRGARDAQISVDIENALARDLATQSAALNWLAAIDAPLSGSLQTSLDSEGAIGPMNATLALGAGALQPTATATPVRFSQAKTSFTFDPTIERIAFDDVHVKTEQGEVKASGQALLRDVVDGLPQALLGQFTFSQLSVLPNAVYDAALDLTGVAVDFRLRLDPFVIDLGQIVVADPQFPMHARGQFRATPQGWMSRLDLKVDQITAPQILAVWPDTVKPPLKEWLVEYLDQAELDDVKIGWRASPDQDPWMAGGFAFQNTDLRFLKDMPPIQDASGVASFDSDMFAMAIEEGHVIAPEGGRITMAGSSMVMPDVKQKPATMILDLTLDSTVTAVTSLIDLPPLSLMSRGSLPVAIADGRARTSGTLSFPVTRKIKPLPVTFDVSADMRDVRSNVLIPNRQLTASSLQLRARNGSLTVTGPARLDGIPLNGTFERDLDATGRATLSANVQLSQNFLTAFGVNLPSGTISGSGQGALTVTMAKDAAPRYDLRSNLRGIGIAIPQLGWRKRQSVAGDLVVAGTLGQRPNVERLEISGDGLAASGRISFDANGGLQAARFDRVRLGNWLNAPITLRGRGRGRPVGVDIAGGTIDLRQAQFGGRGGESGPMNVALDRLQITEGISLTGFRGEFGGGRGLSGQFSGLVNGEARVQGTVVPQSGRTALRITSEDAGSVARATGILKDARGGALDLTLRPAGAAGTFDGTLAIERLRVRNASAMAELLDAISVVGLLQQLDGQGLSFDEVDATFRLTPSQVILTQASAVGPGLGISLDGIYTLATKSLDMQGVVSPFYLINSIGSILTRRGEGLIGFAFTVRGTSSAPNVGVNPLSVLTPGMFREIFRRAPPEVSQ